MQNSDSTSSKPGGDRISELSQRERLLRPSAHPVLIVEDRKENQLLLKGLCRDLDVEASIAENGQVALDLMAKERRFSIFIVDLMMPVMDGVTFIRELKKIEPDAVVLVETALDSPDTVIDTMKLGVFDYIIKPIDNELFQQTLQKALEFRYLKDLERNLVENAGLKLRGQLEWLMSREEGRTANRESIDRNAIYNLKTSLSQGEGVGTMVSLVDMIRDTARRDGDDYVVDRDLAQLLFENNARTRAVLQGLDQIVELMDSNLQAERMSAPQLLEMLRNTGEYLEKYAQSRGVTISFGELDQELYVMADPRTFALAFEETLLNACKYAQANTTVRVIPGATDSYLGIAVRNAGNDRGIPREYEKVVLEPFFRLHPPVEDAREYERFSLGLGLTIVDYIIKKHNGLFFIHNTDDEDRKDGAPQSVMAEMFLPIDFGDSG